MRRNALHAFPTCALAVTVNRNAGTIMDTLKNLTKSPVFQGILSFASLMIGSALFADPGVGGAMTLTLGAIAGWHRLHFGRYVAGAFVALVACTFTGLLVGDAGSTSSAIIMVPVIFVMASMAISLGYGAGYGLRRLSGILQSHTR